ncbi:acyltransferase family protein [Arthrobacter sp. zg-Y1110]|uniref:acyltransferase family protein n=1 Tax=Arthrobacter sp. zg-Y1110 TaxID=2886932 RepID=UPI001D138D6A|nr:acyltransferase family protein [Arthrobacter sp. zg-Y1110]MCC3292504.1 acyltransferase [Arthrobacter sp. zg-Y1110]UWX87064.1 acyltransferase [Arthrobacter sp. zg-Y1110]
MTDLIPAAAPSAPNTRGRHRAARTQPRPGYRPEVQGLRALAVLMVVAYHVWFDRVSGGVDIFLLISAFLMTLSFLRKGDEGTGMGLVSYWLRTFSRLLPAGVTAMLGTMAAAWLFLPKARWDSLLEQVWSSLGYFQNWALAAESVDYYADHSGASPLQHFWSLSVQGQIFILWPLLFTLAALVARTFRLRYRSVVAALFTLVFAASLAFSVWETSANQAFAYFDTRARLWEFALGTLLAVALPLIRLPRPAAAAAGWIGLALMLSAGFLIDVEGSFPGYIALWPLIAAALIISAGTSGSRFGVDRFLSWKPMVRLGGISYALYLWHWPVLVIYMAWRGREAVGVPGGSAIIALSLLLAWLTTRLIERPLLGLGFMKNKRGQLIAVIALAAIAAGPAYGWQTANRIEAEKAVTAHERELAEARARGEMYTQEQKDNPGALSLLDQAPPPGTPGAATLPALDMLGSEWASVGPKCEEGLKPTGNDMLADSCQHLAGRDGAKRILAIGNSHTQQWTAALAPMAEKYGYDVVFVSKGGCSFGATDEGRPADCVEFNKAALQYALDLKPDAVFTVATAAQPEDASEHPVPGLAEAANKLEEAGIQVVGIRDTPRFAFDMAVCIKEEGPDGDRCNTRKTEKLADTSPTVQLGAQVPGMAFMDLTDQVCPDGVCPPVIGNVHVYMDNNHLTSTFTRSTAPVFEDRFHEAIGWKRA